MSEQEAMEILETDWKSHKDLCEMFLKEGQTPQEIVKFLDSFA